MLCATLSILCAIPDEAIHGPAHLIFTTRDASGPVWLYILSNVCTSSALFATVLVLYQVMRKKRDIRLRMVAVLTGTFFFSRAITQLFGIWTALNPAFRVRWEVTLTVSALAVAMAATLVWLLPVLHRIPSISDLEEEIRDRRRAEEEAIAKEERFRAFVESVEDYAIYMIDPEGTVLSWNPGAERMKGYKAEEVVGQNFSHFYSAEDRAAGKPQMALKIASEMGRFEGEGWRVRKDGTSFLANVVMRPMRDVTGAVRGFSKVTRDLTQSRDMEARHQMLLEAVPSAIVIVNRAGNVEYLNAQAESLFGHLRGDIVGQSVDILVPPRSREEQAAYMNALLDGSAHPMPSGPDEFFGLRKDGSDFPLEFSVSPLQTRDGGVLLFAIHDLTERKKAAELLAQNMLALRHSNEELEQFAHIASHDLQEPLRMVASYLQLLSRRYQGRLDLDADEFIQFAVSGTHRMKRLIEDLLKYSRIGRKVPPTHQLRSEDALRQALGNLQAAIEESGAQVTWEPLPRVTAAETQLVQLFQNLVGNAIKYRGERAPRIHVSAKAGESVWIFSVSDNGIGIEAKYFDRIFAIFQRLHGREEYEGTGIGLAICKRILQQQGGRIWVESEPGHGSTFHFALPMEEATFDPSPPANQRVFRPRSDRWKTDAGVGKIL